MLCFLCYLLFNAFPASATEPDHGLKLEQDVPNNLWRLSWPSVYGKTYFIQHTDDLLTGWDWLPMIEPGNGQMKEWGMTSNGDKAFWRLASSDIPTTDPQNDDFDGDGISNLAELMQGTNPLENLDLDNDGLPDDWERAYGLNPNDPSDGGEVDSDGDGLTNRQEVELGTNPMEEDSDGDGINDDEDGWAWIPQLSPKRLPISNYAIIELSTVGNSRAKFINHSGQVVIEEPTGVGENKNYFLWQEGVRTAITGPAGWTIQSVEGLGGGGKVVGKAKGMMDGPTTGPMIHWSIDYNYDENGNWHYVGDWAEINGTGSLSPEYDAVRAFVWDEGATLLADNGTGLESPTDFKFYYPFVFDLEADGAALTGISYSGPIWINEENTILALQQREIVGLAALSITETEYDSAVENILHQETLPLETTSTSLVEWLTTGNSGEMKGQGAVLWSGEGYSANLLGDYWWDLSAAANRKYFDPKGISDTGVILGKETTTSSTQWKYRVGATFHDLGITGDWAAISPNNHIIDNGGIWIDTQVGPKNELPPGATPQYQRIALTPDKSDPVYGVKLNKFMQSAHGYQLWQNAKSYNLDELTPATQGEEPTWAYIYASDINDSGLISGIATKISNNTQRAVLLAPVHFQSKDRILRGSIDIPEGWTQFGLSFKNKDTDQDFGNFTNLEPGATTDVKIYDSPDDFFSDEEMEENQSGSLPDNAKNQKVTFARDPENPRKLQFCAVFDDVGEIEVKLKFGPNQIEGLVSHTLTADAAMADFINTMNERVTSIEVPGSEELPIDTDGDGFPNSLNPNDIIHGHQPGTVAISGAIVHEELEDDPLNLVLPINSDDDDGNSQPDNADTTITSGDNDITRIVLKRPVLATGSGTLTLTVSNASAVRVFNSNGSAVMSSYSVNLASPSGDLAGLAQLNGSVPMHVEGLTESANVTFTLTYRNTNNEVVSSDSVHLTVADPASLALLRMVNGFQSVAGNSSQVRLRTYDDNGAMSLRTMDLAPIGENPPIQNRGMLSKVLWDVAIHSTQAQLAWTKGFVDGFWIALKGEKDTVVGVWTFFRDDPLGRAAIMSGLIQENIGKLKDLPAGEIPGLLTTISQHLWEDLYTQAENALPWAPVDPPPTLVLKYMEGFAAGMVSEGVAVSLLGVGLVTKTATAVKGIIAFAKTSRYVLTVLDAVRKATLKTTHILMRVFKSERGSLYIGSIGKRLEKIELPSGKKATEGFEEALRDKPEVTDNVVESYHYHTQAIADEARAATRIQKCAHSLAELQDIMGSGMTDDMIEGFTHAQKKLFAEGVDNLDRWPDMKALWKGLDSPQKKESLKKSLEAYKTAVEGDADAKFWIKDLDTVQTKGYRYVTQDELDLINNSSGSLPPHNGKGWYCSLENYASAVDAKNALQLPQAANNFVARIEFNLSDVKNNIRMPFDAQDLNKASFEPTARAYPDFGAGGGTQIIVDGVGMPVTIHPF